MGIIEVFGDNGYTLIDGVRVTEENKENLISKSMRNKSLEYLGNARREIAFLWNGKANILERDRILELVDHLISEI